MSAAGDDQTPVGVAPETASLLWSFNEREAQADRDRFHERSQLHLKDVIWRSRLLEFYARQTSLRDRRPSRRKAEVVCPKTFSFIENPDLAIQTLSEFVTKARDGAHVIHLDQQRCEHLDLCALTALNALALDARKRLKMGFTGHYPESEEAREIVTAAGLPRLLGVPVPDTRTFKIFRLTQGGNKNPKLSINFPSRKEKASSRLALYIDDCLKLYGFCFKPDGLARLGKLAGEVLDNAENHASEWPWYVSGYLRQPETSDFGDCHLVFLNFGPSIAETLQHLPEDTEIRRRIVGLVELHRKEGFFSPRWTEEQLWTLYALQEYVSRFYDDRTRGLGTADMIEAFQTLGQTGEGEKEPIMALISGRTRITFDLEPAHTMRRATADEGQEVRRIAFNETNDLQRPPDRGAVQSMANYFPGTLISLRFFLDQRHLKTLIPKT
jgi:hypothetical protein